MRKLDQRGVAAFEFCIVAVAIFTLIYAIFDLGRYAIAMQSLRSLAGAGARAAMINKCYTDAALKKTTTVTCSGDYTTDAQKRALVPFLYANNLAPTVTTVTGTSAVTVTASLQGFSMMFPTIWGSGFTNPSASTQIPLPN
ncbi:pilus assembly protein [Bradyrhizobium huanghuaihaiense]|uniref:TadE/TadG family type IV pilus assembly protein n=1 Tax=Bradyrhizobium huanghuaihaiense TaxID=990078 RepID=UPI0021AA8448|nr:TadE family protein [Bradyrhizobium sp. CB3035]UWU74044.1 pilus assembly protein [Bradyrhizobium sp. CB3035]